MRRRLPEQSRGMVIAPRFGEQRELPAAKVEHGARLRAVQRQEFMRARCPSSLLHALPFVEGHAEHAPCLRREGPAVQLVLEKRVGLGGGFTYVDARPRLVCATRI